MGALYDYTWKNCSHECDERGDNTCRRCADAFVCDLAAQVAALRDERDAARAVQVGLIEQRDSARREVAALKERLAAAERDPVAIALHSHGMGQADGDARAERLESALREAQRWFAAFQREPNISDEMQRRMLVRGLEAIAAALAPPQAGEVDAGMPAGTAPEEAAGGEACSCYWAMGCEVGPDGESGDPRRCYTCGAMPEAHQSPGGKGGV